MFPSGKWTGHWDQNGFGRQNMHDLEFTFNGTRFSGSGHDVVGQFTMTGQVLDDQKVEIVKSYEGRHSVVYLGSHDGEGIIAGAWALWGDEGSFAMRPMVGFNADDAPIADIQF